MAELVLGPILRAVHRDSVTVWVETDSPCEVAVGSTLEQTVSFMGHHYAFVTIDGLGAGEPYTVTSTGSRCGRQMTGSRPACCRRYPRID